MPSLGGSFPTEFKKNHFLNSVKPGCVVRVNIKFPEITKYKFLVILAEDDGDYLSFFINSEVNQYIENKPALAKCQVLIKQEQHAFLKYDSYVACHELYPICQSDVLNDLLNGIGSIQGNINSELTKNIIAAVESAKTINNANKSRVIEALNQTLT